MNNFFKYLSYTPGNKDWGVNIITSGYHQIRPGDSYPPTGHPISHLFEWSEGRKLNGYYLVYIPTGAGMLETREKLFVVNPGDMLMLYSNEWHRYKPNSQEGWEEYWIGFEGDFFEGSIEQEVFPESRSYVKRLGYKEEIIFLMSQSLELIRRNTKGYRKILAGILIQLLAYTITSEEYELKTGEQNLAEETIKLIRTKLYRRLILKNWPQNLT